MRGIPAKLITCNMNCLKKFILAAVSVLTFTSMSAQQRLVRGKVYDETSQPLAGASVSVPNTLRGVTTDGNGLFEINASSGETLSIAFLGYVTKSVNVGEKDYIEVTLMPDTNQLDELVVIGYGTQKRVNITGAVSTVPSCHFDSADSSGYECRCRNQSGIRTAGPGKPLPADPWCRNIEQCQSAGDCGWFRGNYFQCESG